MSRQAKWTEANKWVESGSRPVNCSGKSFKRRNIYKELHDITKKLVGKYSKEEWPIRNKEEEPISKAWKQRNRWIEEFKELLCKLAPMNPPDTEAANTDLYIDDTSLTREFCTAVKQIKNGKVEGLNSLPFKALNSDIDVAVKTSHVLLKKKIYRRTGKRSQRKEI